MNLKDCNFFDDSSDEDVDIKDYKPKPDEQLIIEALKSNNISEGDSVILRQLKESVINLEENGEMKKK